MSRYGPTRPECCSTGKQAGCKRPRAPSTTTPHAACCAHCHTHRSPAVTSTARSSWGGHSMRSTSRPCTRPVRAGCEATPWARACRPREMSRATAPSSVCEEGWVEKTCWARDWRIVQGRGQGTQAAREMCCATALSSVCKEGWGDGGSVGQRAVAGSAPSSVWEERAIQRLQGGVG